MTRQERRARLKDSIAQVSRRGMNLSLPRADQLWQVIACTRLLIDILDGKAPARSSEAVKRAHEFFEVSLKHNPSDYRIACTKGCGFCCHLRVTAIAPEIFHLANHIRHAFKDDLPSVIARVRSADTQSRGIDSRERTKRHIACGLLVDNACSVYAARPSSCRALTSIAVDTCKRGYDGEDVDILTPAVWTDIRSAHNQALWAAFAHAGLASENYELNHGLLIALEQPDAETRWLAGEDVFADVARDDTIDPAIKQKICDRLIAGAFGKELPPW